MSADPQNDFRLGDDENVILRKILSRLPFITSGGGGGGGTLSTDGTFAANSDALYPSQKAAKTYIDTADALRVLKSGDTMSGLLTLNAGTNVAAGQSYQLNGQPVIRALTTLNGYFFAGAGNLTMTGANNVGLGASTLIANTSGIDNTMFGSQCYSLGTVGSGNTGFGYNVLAVCASEQNCAFGRRALVALTTGNSNTGLGYRALAAVNTGANNLALGALAGDNLTTGSNCTIIGGNSIDFQSISVSNQLVISGIIFGTGCSATTTGQAGSIGIGVVAPTATLHLRAGTATASTAPLKISAGTLLAAVELGAIELVDNGTTGHLYVTLNVAGVLTRVQIV